jgi:CubicO group peptidase (beta-lactamase class C family)
MRGHAVTLAARGITGAHDAAPPDADTLFSLGSVTKVLTGVLLADEVVRRRVGLEEPVQDLFADLALPRFDDRAIDFLDLVTHRSGLPWMPTNWVTVDQGEYTPEMWRTFLSSYALPFAPGTRVAYGNVAFGLLGDALERRENAPFRALLQARVLSPLGMSETSFLREHPAGLRWAEGHDDAGAPVPRDRDAPRMPACCAVQSTARDMMRLIDAALHPSGDDVSLAVRASLETYGSGDGEWSDVDLALGWMVRKRDGVATKNGIMRGFRATIAVDRAREVGVVVLAASATVDTDALAGAALALADWNGP